MQENPAYAAACRGFDVVSVSEREAEFERLVLSRRPRMVRAIWRVVRNTDLADDAFQEALTTLWKKLPTVAGHPNPEALILRVCLNAAYDQLRAHVRQRHRDVSLEGPENAWKVARVARAGPSQDSGVVEEVLWAIGRLRRRQATAILMRAVHEESYETIAQALGCSEVSARVHVLRAREQLRRRLSHLCRPSREESAR